MIKFDIITIFPEMLNSYFNESIIKRAQKKHLIKINIHNLRNFTKDKSRPQSGSRSRSGRRQVDDKPYGGGPGMVMTVEPIYRCVSHITNGKLSCKKQKVILFSPKGKKFDEKMAKKFAKLDRLIMICGRYEGVDERVAKYIADEEISTGDYILTGGEIPAMVVVDAVSRFIPGVLGKEESLEEIKGSYPTYAKPEVFKPDKNLKKVLPKRAKRSWRVPKVLLSGNHKKIEEWRKGLTR